MVDMHVSAINIFVTEDAVCVSDHEAARMVQFWRTSYNAVCECLRRYQDEGLAVFTDVCRCPHRYAITLPIDRSSRDV